MSETNGEKKRAISFDLSNPSHYTLYQFSKSLNLSEFVRKALAQEYSRQQSSKGAVSLRVKR